MIIQKRIESGYYKVHLGDLLFRAERTIQFFQGRNQALLSPNEKDALIAALSTVVMATGGGFRPSANVTSVVSSLCYNESLKE